MHMVHKSTKTTPGTQQYVPGKIFEVLCEPETHLAVDKALSASKGPTAQDLAIVVFVSKMLIIASSERWSWCLVVLRCFCRVHIIGIWYVNHYGGFVLAVGA